MTLPLRGMLVCLLVLFIAGPARAAPAMPPGPQQDAAIAFELLIVYPGTRPASTSIKQALTRWPAFKQVDTFPEPVAGMLVQSKTGDDFAASSAESIKSFGRGLTPAQALAMQKRRYYTALQFRHNKQDALPALRAAYELTVHLARRDAGLVWDAETRELFTPEAFEARRLATWTERYPMVSANTTIHMYRDGDLLREISLGMIKFGLPDIVINQLARSSGDNMGHLINLLGQALLEGGSVGPRGSYDLAIDTIVNKAVRTEALAMGKANAKKTAKLVLSKGVLEEGDPDNRLIEIGFERYPGPDNNARQDALLSSLFGATDAVKQIRHNDALREASAKAKVKLAQKETLFKRGLKPGENIQVKAPFETDTGGNEWMWVEIMRWEGDKIEGVLTNTPFHIKKLKAGQLVRIRLQDVFDYIHTFPDGHDEGNTTGAIIQKMQDAR